MVRDYPPPGGNVGGGGGVTCPVTKELNRVFLYTKAVVKEKKNKKPNMTLGRRGAILITHTREGTQFGRGEETNPEKNRDKFRFFWAQGLSTSQGGKDGQHLVQGGWFSPLSE